MWGQSQSAWRPGPRSCRVNHRRGVPLCGHADIVGSVVAGKATRDAAVQVHAGSSSPFPSAIAWLRGAPAWCPGPPLPIWSDDRARLARGSADGRRRAESSAHSQAPALLHTACAWTSHHRPGIARGRAVALRPVAGSSPGLSPGHLGAKYVKDARVFPPHRAHRMLGRRT